LCKGLLKVNITVGGVESGYNWLKIIAELRIMLLKIRLTP
jgi:hypothetical protein